MQHMEVLERQLTKVAAHVSKSLALQPSEGVLPMETNRWQSRTIPTLTDQTFRLVDLNFTPTVLSTTLVPCCDLGMVRVISTSMTISGSMGLNRVKYLRMYVCALLSGTFTFLVVVLTTLPHHLIFSCCA